MMLSSVFIGRAKLGYFFRNCQTRPVEQSYELYLWIRSKNDDICVLSFFVAGRSIQVAAVDITENGYFFPHREC